MKRRNFGITLMSTLGALNLGPAVTISRADDGAANPLGPAWTAWKAAFLSSDGRVVDTAQGEASHSESQSYGMTLAVALRDKDTFTRILAWSLQNLAVREDSLLAWRWLPSGPVRVPDLNNASDGDLFFAWALGRAATVFNTPAYAERASEMARSLAAQCVVPWPDGSGRMAFLPAAQGFTRNDTVIVNLSYAMPLAMREVAAASGADGLRRAAEDAETLMAQLSLVGTIPDWFSIGPDGPYSTPEFSDRTGYEAMRVPLFLLWSGNPVHPAVQRHSAVLRTGINTLAFGATPTVIDRLSGRTIESSFDPGYAAVAALIDCVSSGGDNGSVMPPFTAAQPYYPATLHLMALLAQQEGYPGCLPL